MKRSKVVAGGAAAIVALGVVCATAAFTTHGNDRTSDAAVNRLAAGRSAVPVPASNSHPEVGATNGYNITNESDAILIYGSVGGHVSAPPLAPGGAWLPGQTLNFEVYTGKFGMANNTGDAFFEAYTIGDENTGTDAGTVDIHFNTGVSGVGAVAYLNPADTAPLTATSPDFPPMQADGETWTMSSNLSNYIMAGTATNYSVGPAWNFAGVSQTQLLTSVTTAPNSECTTPTSCTLGNVTWNFTGQPSKR